MKVLMVTEWHPLTIGGVQKHVYELSKHLIERGFDVQILTKMSKKTLNTHQTTPPIIEVDSITPFQNILTPPNLSKIKEAITQYSPDVIHVHHAFTPTPLLTLYIAEKMGMPKILTNHSAAGNSTNSILTLMSCKGLMFLRYFIAKADRVISVSKCAATFIENLLGNDVESIIIPNGVNVHRFHPPKNEVDTSLVLFVGRLVHRKGVHVLIKAFSRVVEEEAEAKLLIAGEGYMKPFLQMRVKQLKLEGKIKFLGKISEEKLANVYRSSRIVVIPSLYRESFGMVALEAMASGRPIIATRVGGLPEIIQDGKNGFLTPPGDHEKLAEKIVQLLSNPKMANEMGFLGRKIAVENYSWDTVAEQIVNVYFEAAFSSTSYLDRTCGVKLGRICQAQL